MKIKGRVTGSSGSAMPFLCEIAVIPGVKQELNSKDRGVFPSSGNELLEKCCHFPAP